MGTHPSFNPTSGPSTAYQPKTADESDGTIAGSVVPFVNSQTKAGEEHIGSIGGESAHPSATPVATALTYAAGKCIGGPVALNNFLRVAGKSSLIQSATLRCKGALTVEVDAYVFRDAPTVLTGLADGATFAVDPADIAKVSKVLKFVTMDQLGTGSAPTISTIDGIGKLMGLANGVNAQVQLVSRGALTLPSADALTIGLGLITD